MRTVPIVLASACVLLASLARGADWPQWLGPDQESTWREVGIVERFPDEGLPVRWRVPVELGYSGPVVADGRVYVTDYVKTAGTITNNPGTRDELHGHERVLCFDAATGDVLWKHEYEQPYHFSYSGGPRATPTVADGRVYTVGAEGKLLCLDATDGTVHWQKDYKTDYGVETPQWGFSAHPLVHGDVLYCVVGGEGTEVVAFDKTTGKEIWRALSAPEPGYCGPTIIEHEGQEQLVVWHPLSVNGLDAQTGKLYWTFPLQPNAGMSMATPRQHGEYLYASGYGTVAALVKLGPSQTAEVLWRGEPKTAVYSSFGPPYFEGDTIYGTDLESGALMAVRQSDGERLWETMQPTTGTERSARYGTAYLVKHEDRYFLFSEQGDLILATLSPEGYEELSRFHVLEPTERIFGRNVVWSHPAFANQCVYARNDKELVCVGLAAGE